MKKKETKVQIAAHKLGDNHNEFANKPRRIKPGFKQSRDVHEDRGRMQSRMGRIK